LLALHTPTLDLKEEIQQFLNVHSWLLISRQNQNIYLKASKSQWILNEDPSDPIVNQIVNIAYGDAKMAWNMPGTLPMSHQKIRRVKRT